MGCTNSYAMLIERIDSEKRRKDMGYGDDHHPDLAHPLVQEKISRTNWDGYPQHSIEEMGKQIMEFAKKLKDTNPKDAVGVKKAPISTVSGPVMLELGLAMLEGARKYGRHNYRVSGVRASVYVDAAFRHLIKWWEGEDDDRDSDMSHIIKAMASLHVLRDAMIVHSWVDDRPPAVPKDYIENLNKKAAKIVERYSDAKDPFTQVGLSDEDKRPD
jgi:hypothetical protein